MLVGEGLDEDNLEESEVILSNDAIPKELGVKRMVRNNLLGCIPTDEMMDDGDIIDYYLKNSNKFIPCKYF